LLFHHEEHEDNEDRIDKFKRSLGVLHALRG